MASPGRLTTIVLGSAAGGGFPQWNCRCAVCSLAWADDPRVRARTQTGLAVSGDGERWVLLNASPDLGAQLRSTPRLRPRAAPRGTPVAAVVLTGGEIDQAAGLLHLREGQRFALYATAETLSLLGENPMFDALAEGTVERREAALDAPVSLPGGVEIELFAVPGKVPLYKEGESEDLAEETAGAEVRANGARLVFIPGIAALTPAVHERLARADAVLFDATLYTDDEMIRAGTGAKTGRRMGHMPLGGEDGTLKALANLTCRRILIHINNTNPVLVDGSPERAHAEASGWEVAEDGQEIVL